MHAYLRWFSQQGPEAPAVTRDDGKNCGSCVNRDEVDYAPCNACSRAWGNSGRHLNWEPISFAQAA
jgi:hypothetical protein